MAEPEPDADADARFEQGCEAYNKGEWDRAFALFKPLADRGDPRAQHWLSAQYRLGLGAPRDLEQAWALILEAAAADYKPARQHMAGECVALMGGFSGAPNEYREKAVQWLREDALAGDLDALTHIGHACLFGFPPYEQDAAQALHWFLKAAEQGHSAAQFELGGLYASSNEGVERDLKLSLGWYVAAAEQGYVRAQMHLARAYEKGGAGIRKDQSKARYWFRQAAEGGDLWAARSLVKRYERGLGVEPDPAEAFRWRLQAAILGDASEALRIGKAFASGRGIAQRDDVQAYVWLSLAAMTDERGGHARIAKSAPARDKVEARLAPSQIKEGQALIEALKIRFIGDADRWVRKPVGTNP